MATKIIKKVPPRPIVELHPITSEKIFHWEPICAPQVQSFQRFKHPATGNRLVASSSIRNSINIKVKSQGEVEITQNGNILDPLTSTVLGNQFDHQVQWLHFDLKDLLWQATDKANPSYEEKDYYSLYNFHLAFWDTLTETESRWDFDGIDFKIPVEITRTFSNYNIVLIISEYKNDLNQGNVPDKDETEIFISNIWMGNIVGSFFNPDWLNSIYPSVIDSSQTKALIKNPLNCTLSDDGYFAWEGAIEPVTQNKLGNKQDSFITYLRFKRDTLSGHFDPKIFNLYAVFSNLEIVETETGSDFRHYVVQFENLKFPGDIVSIGDDIDADWVAWVPKEVLSIPGEWKILLIALSKNFITDDPTNPEYEIDYYRLVSNPINGYVDDNFLVDRTIETDDNDAFYSNLETRDQNVIIDYNNAILRGEEKNGK